MLNRLLTVDNIRLQSAGSAVSTFLPFDPSSRKLPKDVVIRATGNGAYVRLSDDRSAATNADMLVQPGDHVVCSVAHRRWVSVLAVSGSTTVSVGALSTGVGRSIANPDPFAQDGPVLDLVFAGVPNDPLDVASTTDDTLELNFVAQAYQSAAQYAVWGWGTGGLQEVNFADIVTFTRASTATYFNSAGTLTSAAINEARFDYDPSTLAIRGLLIEEARTNSIRNNTMVGAVAGTPGTLPTNWAITGSGLGTLTQQVVGTGTANGITYIDIKLSGTTSTTGLSYSFEPTVGGPAASSGQTWTGSNYVALVGGSITNINQIRGAALTGRAAGGTATTDLFVTADSKALLTSTLQRFSVTGTLADATTVALQPNVVLSFSSGAAIDITLRIGLPQLELGAFATSVIPTTTTALTRSADVASVNTLSPWYNATEGSIYFEASSIAVNGYPFSLFGSSTQNRIFANYATLDRMQVGTRESGNFSLATTLAGTAPLNTVGKGAMSYKVNDGALSWNGAATIALSPLPTALPTILRLDIGNNGSLAGNWLNGHLRRITYYPRRLSNADLQTLTT